MRNAEPRIALYIRIPATLANRIEKGRLTGFEEHSWRAPNKQDYLISILDRELPGAAPKKDPRQLDIEDHIAHKAKARKVTRKAARAKITNPGRAMMGARKRSKAKAARKAARK